ncbi:MAG: hypothetical protein QXY15_10520 [Candidatus Nitrosotenuis sp.]
MPKATINEGLHYLYNRLLGIIQSSHTINETELAIIDRIIAISRILQRDNQTSKKRVNQDVIVEELIDAIK